MAQFGNAEQTAASVERAFRSLLPERVEILCQPVSDLVWQLYPSEREIIGKAIEKRQWEFATGRVLARRALEQIGTGATEIPVGEAREPIWPANVRGSISHSTELCGVAVARASDVLTLGIDIERVGAVTADVMPLVGHESELRAHADQFSEEELYALLFSAREAIFKAYNPVTGSYLAHKDVELSLSRGSFLARLTAPERPALHGATTISGRYAFVDGMVLSSVCLAGFGSSQAR